MISRTIARRARWRCWHGVHPVPCPSLISPGVLGGGSSELLDRTSVGQDLGVQALAVGVGIVVVELSPLVVHGLVRIVPSAKSSIGKPMRCAYASTSAVPLGSVSSTVGKWVSELGVDIALRSARSACRSARKWVRRSPVKRLEVR